MKRTNLFSIGMSFLLTLIIACKTTDQNDEKRGSETFEMADKNGNYWSVKVDLIGDGAVYRKTLIHPTTTNEVFGGLHLIVSEEVKNEIGKIKFLAGKKYWFIPIDRDTIYALDTGGGSTSGPPTGEYYCECEEANEFGQTYCKLALKPNYTCSYWWYNECKKCDLRWCPSSRVSGPSMPYGTLIEASEVSIENIAPSELRSSTESYFGGDVKIEVYQNGSSTVEVKRQRLGNVSYSKDVYNLTGRGILNGKVNLLSGVSYWFVPFDSNQEAFRITGGSTTSPTCIKRSDNPCSTDCILQPTEKDERCLECVCDSNGEGDCDMRAGSYNLNYSGGVLVQAEILIMK